MDHPIFATIICYLSTDSECQKANSLQEFLSNLLKAVIEDPDKRVRCDLAMSAYANPGEL